MKKLSEIKKQREEEKKRLEQIKAEEEALEKEVNEEMPETNFSIKEAINLLKAEDEEEQEYRSLLTEEELKEEERQKKEEIKMARTAIIVLVAAAIFVTVGVNVYYNIFKSDLLKVTEPLLKNHYEQITGEKAKTKTIEEFTTKDENRKDVGTGIYLLTTEDNKHIMSVNNELIGDDIQISQKKEEIKSYVRERLGNIELITETINLSYDDYYVTYNRFMDYMNVLPSKLSSEELINSNKLALTYKAIYKGDLDILAIENMIGSFSNNSSILLYKQDMTGISNVTYITKDKTYTLNITAEIEKDNGITYLELDRNINGVIDVNVGVYANSSVSSENDYNIINPISIKKEVERRNRDEEPKPEYYLLKVSSSLISENSFVELSTSKREDTYREIKKENYKDVHLLGIGSYTYIFSENELFLGEIRGEKTFLCKLGIC